MQFFLCLNTKLNKKIRTLYGQSLNTEPTAGFTLLEFMVVVIMVGTLVAIAAPTWQSLLDRQRMNAARGDLMSVLKTAQDEAQSRQQKKQVTFLPATATTPLSVAVRNLDLQSSTTSFVNSPSTVTVLGNGEVGLNFTIVTSDSDPIVFNSKGEVEDVNIMPYVISIRNTQLPAPPAGQSPTQSCVIITTLLGGLKPANDDLCDSFMP
ncbi:MAG: pseudopilin HpsD [Phormidesmis priestleyi Ana]|uniref:Pseudopilin HpsD n=1 Tax=Phormidesmis priestleyi Ana TaxID=1666911 RepID=A0A0P8BRW8_9CYAN|nr:MAG: pseudopilin HpsD [Phormidesmis priestleyi Ana]